MQTLNDTHIHGAPVVGRSARGSVLRSVLPHGPSLRPLGVHLRQHPASRLGDLFADGAVAGSPVKTAHGHSRVLAATPVCRREYAGSAIAASDAITGARGITGRMWNRTTKFDPFDHFQRWRCAT